jgi:hypothetical protein
MKIHEPIPHWTHFTVPELKQILKHCSALENLGIAQDNEMTRDIERDITMREKKAINARNAPFEPKYTKIKQAEKRHPIKISQSQQPQEYLLEQNI